MNTLDPTKKRLFHQVASDDFATLASCPPAIRLKDLKGKWEVHLPDPVHCVPQPQQVLVKPAGNKGKRKGKSRGKGKGAAVDAKSPEDEAKKVEEAPKPTRIRGSWTLLEDGTATDHLGRRPPDKQLTETVHPDGAVEKIKRFDGWFIDLEKSNSSHLVWHYQSSTEIDTLPVEWVRVEEAPSPAGSACSAASSCSTPTRKAAQGRKLCVKGASKRARFAYDEDDLAPRTEPSDLSASQGQEPTHPHMCQMASNELQDVKICLTLFAVVKSGKFKEAQALLSKHRHKVKCKLKGNQHGGCANQTLVFAAVQAPENCHLLCHLLVESFGLDPNHCDAEKRSPIFYLIRSSSYGKLDHMMECLRYLLRKSVDDVICFSDSYSFTPLFSAVYLDKPLFIYELAWLVNKKDKFGNTAARYAHDPSTVAALLNCGAKLRQTQAMLERQAAQEGEVSSAMEYVKRISRHAENILPDSFGSVFRPDGSVYTVMVAKPSDREAILNLEQEFLDDHMRLWPSLSREQVIDEVGSPMRQFPAEAFGCMQGSQLLKCLHLPPSRPEKYDDKEVFFCDPPCVVGYLLLTIHYDDSEFTKGSINMSHLKVSNKHSRNNCGSLLLASAVRQIGTQLSTDMPGRPGMKLLEKPWSFQLTLSVAEDNAVAISLYEQFGFKEVTLAPRKGGLKVFQGRKKDAPDGFYELRKQFIKEVHRHELKAWLREMAKSMTSGAEDKGQEIEGAQKSVLFTTLSDESTLSASSNDAPMDSRPSAAYSSASV